MKVKKEIAVVKLKMVKDSSVPYGGHSLADSANVAKLFRSFIDDSDREILAVCATDCRLHPVMIQSVGVGDVNACAFSAANVFKAAIIANATSIFLAHNHPSGDVEPSDGDREATKRIKEAGKILGIELLDHVIIGNNTDEFYSFRDHGGMADL
jgi:DNA repair protein RadC